MFTEFVIGGAGCGGLCLLCYYAGYRRSALRYDIIAEVPTIGAKDIPGLGAAMVEVKGTVECAQPLISDLALVPCVAFECSITEHWTTTRTERDSKGNSRTVTEHHSATRYSNDGRTVFQIRDETGAVTILPDGASIDLLDAMELRGISQPLAQSLASDVRAHHLGGHLSYSENVLPAGQWVYALGQVTAEHDIAQPEDVERPFIISFRDEKTLLQRAAWEKRIYGLLSSLLFLAAFGLLAYGLGMTVG